jgi:hypothetical protein
MLILPSANQVFFQAIIPGFSDSGAKLDTAYIEFANGRRVEPIETNPETLHLYFETLGSTGDLDYLRLPIWSHTLGRTVTGQPMLTLVVATDGNAGVHGKPFSSAACSRVYAVTLAASRLHDREDIFVARHHYDLADQLEKPETGYVMLTLDLL